MSKQEAPAFYTWEKGDEVTKALALKQYQDAINKVEPIMRTKGSDLYLNIAPNNVSIRDSFTREDYEDFRPEESLPKTPKDSMRHSDKAYYGNGLIWNIINLMTDFTVKGIDISHPNQRIEKFYKEWFNRVNGYETSSMFTNILFRQANVPVKTETARIPYSLEQDMRKTSAADVKPEEIKVDYRTIPWRYTILNPKSLDLLTEEFVSFLGPESFIFGVKIPANIVKSIKAGTEASKLIEKQIPEHIKELIRNNNKYYIFPKDKLEVFYYKRDPWRAWAFPILHSILPDLKMLEKMKLADMAALDGAISSIRLWKLGDLSGNAPILPSPAEIIKLSEILNNNVGGGVMDLVWGPAIDLKETSTDTHKFLGETKYGPVLQAIYAGLGVPPTLTGSGAKSGFTNNFISLKVFTERLDYARKILKSFWDKELRKVQKAMGFRYPAVVTFDSLLTDEAAEKQLLINMWERGLISDESIRERFDLTPEIEEVRARREMKKRKAGLIEPKASPFHNPHHDDDMKKGFANTGAYAPSEFGIELKDKKPGETTPVEHQAKNKPVPTTKPKGQPGQGRPYNSDDKVPRKKKKVKPRTSALFVEGLAKAETMQNEISKIVTPIYLKTIGKKNLREITTEQQAELENFKFALLCQFSIDDYINEEIIKSKLDSVDIPVQISELVKASIDNFYKKNEKYPPIEIVRKFQASAFALFKQDFDGVD